MEKDNEFLKMVNEMINEDSPNKEDSLAAACNIMCVIITEQSKAIGDLAKITKSLNDKIHDLEIKMALVEGYFLKDLPCAGNC